MLPVEFASIPERLARFEQEARAAAALNHPHIAAVFDVGKESVEGESGDVHVHFGAERPTLVVMVNWLGEAANVAQWVDVRRPWYTTSC